MKAIDILIMIIFLGVLIVIFVAISTSTLSAFDPPNPRVMPIFDKKQINYTGQHQIKIDDYISQERFVFTDNPEFMGYREDGIIIVYMQKENER